jgi:hypothetical protein
VRALESDPARRYATAAAMADALAPAPMVIPIAPAVAAGPIAAVSVAAPAGASEDVAAAEAPAADAAAAETAAREAAAAEAGAAEAAARVAAAREVAPVVVPIRPRLVPPAAPTERIVRPALTMTPRRRRDAASPFILLVLPLLLALLIGAFTLGRPAPTNTAVLSATTTPQATPEQGVFPEPTSLPPVEATPEATSLPEATPEPAPPPPASAPVAPTAASPAASVVRSFYDLITQERFDEAAMLWSPRMQANYPPSTNIYGRFDRTRQIVIRDIVPVPQNTGGATVAIDILEVLDSGVTRRWVGTWQMVWDGARWLMDAPNLRAA